MISHPFNIFETKIISLELNKRKKSIIIFHVMYLIGRNAKLSKKKTSVVVASIFIKKKKEK